MANTPLKSLTFPDLSDTYTIPAPKINCKIIAHRGYHNTAAQNTISSFIDAHKEGFEWIEVDIRKCADGIYVLSHDETVTMYNNGASVSVNFTTSNYDTIKTYTWDSAGEYKLCTLQAAFNAMMIYDMNIICDLKNGSNSDIMELASMSGATDKVLLSYWSFSSAYADRDLLNRFKNVPIRCIPSDYANYSTLAGAISNPIFADVNASETTHYQQYLNVALSCGLPIIFSGCTTSNYNRWSVLANGAMANGDLNIAYSQFYNLLNNDFDVVSTITPSANSVTLPLSGSSTITGTSDVNTAGGYVYGFSLNPAIASLTQTGFGGTATFTVTGDSTGSTTLRMFTGSGTIVDVPVLVWDENTFSLSNGQLEKITGGTDYTNGNIYHVTTMSASRRSFVALNGVKPYKIISTTTDTGYYPIPIPSDATSVSISITPNTQFFGPSFYTYSDNAYTRVLDSGWNQGSYSLSFSAGDYDYLTLNGKYDSAGTSYPTEPTELVVAFS